jgi:vacuolar protein sorting-associated protein IST1
MSGANWNVEFKDATSAAQAAAESAEMASIAARAAAQLASHGNYSGEHGTGGFESGAYNRQNTPRKQTAVHSVKDEKSLNDQSSCTNDPRMILSNEGKHYAGAETNCLGGQNMSTAYRPSQDIHSYDSESHAYVYGMPAEPSHADSPEPPHFDDLYDRESNIGRHDHPMDFPGEKFQGTALGGRNVSDMNVNQVSSDHESTDDYYDNYSSSHGTFTHGGRTVWDDQTDKTQVNPSSTVFDQYVSDVEEENVFDTFTSKHTEQLPGVSDNMESTNADWRQQHRSHSPSNHRTSDLFSRVETQKSDTSEANRRDIPSPHLYDHLPPTFDSDGGSSNEEIPSRPTTMHAESLRSHSKGSTNSGKLVGDVNESEDYHDFSSGKKYGTSPGRKASYMKQLESGHSPRYDYSQAKVEGNLSHLPSRETDTSDEESEPEPDKLIVSSLLRANENRSLPFATQTSATSDDKEEDNFGLNFSRLRPGLRNKPKQPPPYPKSSRDNVLPRQPLHKPSASIEESVDSEDDTKFEPIRSTMKSSRPTKSSSDGSYSSELYVRNPSIETPKEARSTMARNSFHSDNSEHLSEQFGNASLTETMSFEHRSYAQESFHDKPDTGGRRQTRPRLTKNFFDSDDSDGELERQAPQSKWSTEQIPSRRTREVTSGAKRDGLVQTRAQYADESESVPKETKVTQAFSNSNVEQRRNRPDARIPVQRPSARGKLQNAEVPANENTETSAGTPKESTSKTVPAHVHPNLPTDYESFAAHFKSLRTNRH